MINTKDDGSRVVIVTDSSCVRFPSSAEVALLLEKLNDIAVLCFVDEEFKPSSFSGVDHMFELKRRDIAIDLPKIFFLKEDNTSRNESWKRARYEANRNAGLKFRGKR